MCPRIPTNAYLSCVFRWKCYFDGPSKPLVPYMSHARSHSLPVDVLGQKTEKKKNKNLFRRLAKAIPGRKKKNHSPSATNGDDFGSGDSLDPSDSPLTPSTSADSLDVLESASKDDSDLKTAKPYPIQAVEILKEVKPILQCLQSDNKNSQVFI